MSAQEVILREKLVECYATVFEDELIDQILEVGHFDKIKSGDLMIDIDQVLTHIPLILSGVVKILRKNRDGEEMVLYFLESGDTCAISFANCISKKKSIFKGVVEKDTEVILIPVDNIDDWLAKFKTWRVFIIDNYHIRLTEMVDSFDSLAFMKMDERLLKYFANMAKITKNTSLEITHQEIADDLNTSRVVITRLLKKLHDSGHICSTRNKIRVMTC